MEHEKLAVEALSSQKIVDTIGRLSRRIEERFPESGLRDVCIRLHGISENMRERAAWIGQPVFWLRCITWGTCFLILLVTFLPFYFMSDSGASKSQIESFSVTINGEAHIIEDISEETNAIQALGEESKLVELVTLLEAAINDVVLIGAAIFFFLTLETRYKRQRALKAIHELRSIAHIIDMHQLTKDPHRIMSRKLYVSTGLSPKLEMTPFLLQRYLDYCSEMLSLTGKIAAVYVQEFDDGVAMASASELETLTTGLSSKIWQKIWILDSNRDPDNQEKAPPQIQTS